MHSHTTCPQNQGKATNTVTVNLAATNTLVYDLNGNLRTNGTRLFEYDDENRLVTNWVSGEWKSEFVYDGAGRRRIRKEYGWQAGAWVQTNEVLYVYAGSLVIQERDANNAPVVNYTRGLDLSGSGQGAGGIGGLLARAEASSQRCAFYHCDGSGNVTALVNTNQLIVAKYLYDSYGNVLSLSGPLAEGNLYRYSSKEAHVNSRLVYFGARFYDPNLQRWLNRDPIGEQGGVNLYAYAANAPTVALDSWGNEIDRRIQPIDGAWGRLPSVIVIGHLYDTWDLAGSYDLSPGDFHYGGRENPPGGREYGGGGGGEANGASNQASGDKPASKKEDPCASLKAAFARVSGLTRGAIQSLGDLRAEFKRGQFLHIVGGIGEASQVMLPLGVGLWKNAGETAATTFVENGKKYVVSARGLIRPQGHSTYYYTLRSAGYARDGGALLQGQEALGHLFGGQMANDISVIGAILNPAEKASDAVNEMAVESSGSTYEVLQSLQDQLRNISDALVKNNCH